MKRGGLCWVRTHEFIHETIWEHTAFQLSDAEIETWTILSDARDRVLLELERYRQTKIIGKSLEASVFIEADGKRFKELKAHSEEFRKLINVSQFQVESLNKPITGEVGQLKITVRHADGQKCERCWHWETDIGQNAGHPTLCGRCVEAVKQFKM